MDLFSRSKPEMVNPKSLRQISKIYVLNAGEKIPTFGENLLYFYDNYIYPNLFPLVVLIIITLFLMVRYSLKKHKNENYDNTKNKSHKKHSIPHKKNNDYKISFDDTELDDILDDLDSFNSFNDVDDFDN